LIRNLELVLINQELGSGAYSSGTWSWCLFIRNLELVLIHHDLGSGAYSSGTWSWCLFIRNLELVLGHEDMECMTMMSCSKANVQMIYDCVHVFFLSPYIHVSRSENCCGCAEERGEGAKVWVVLREGWYGTQGIYDPLSSPQC
jgi:hypothetical protein